MTIEDLRREETRNIEQGIRIEDLKMKNYFANRCSLFLVPCSLFLVPCSIFKNLYFNMKYSIPKYLLIWISLILIYPNTYSQIIRIPCDNSIESIDYESFSVFTKKRNVSRKCFRYLSDLYGERFHLANYAPAPAYRIWGDKYPIPQMYFFAKSNDLWILALCKPSAWGFINEFIFFVIDSSSEIKSHCLISGGLFDMDWENFKQMVRMQEYVNDFSFPEHLLEEN